MSEATAEDLQKFILSMKSYTPYDFSDYSDKSLGRRLSKVLFDYRMSLDTLIEEIRCNQTFVEKLTKDITVNTTEMFRDPQVWQALRTLVLPELKNRPINIWHAGCSTGQEVYSLMILMSEFGLFEHTNFYATDINEDVIDIAKKGVYKYRFNINYLENLEKAMSECGESPGIAVDTSKYFLIDKTKDIIKMHDFLCKKPIYSKHDLVKDNGLNNLHFDLILCRNVIIYFNTQLQNRVFHQFYNSLHSKGILLLGLHESILGPFSGNFDKKYHFFYLKK